VKRISYKGDSGDHPNNCPLSCTLWIRDFIIKYSLGGNILVLFPQIKSNHLKFEDYAS
jgi:hypothetical protein